MSWLQRDLCSLYRPRRMAHRRLRISWIGWMVVLLSLSLLPIVRGVQTKDANKDKSDSAPPVTYDVMSFEELDAMTDAELEQLCLERGFEMVRDDVDEATGDVYQLQHADFVEGARRCLAIEKEMNDLLNEHPELADELDDEINRLAREAKKLEKIRDQRMSEVNRLQKELKQKLEKEGSIDNTGPLAVDKSHIKTASASSTSGAVKDDLTLKALAVEIAKSFLQQVEQDMKRVFGLILPSVQPFINVGGHAWRHLLVMFESAKAKRKESDANNRKDKDKKKEEEPETCDFE